MAKFTKRALKTMQFSYQKHNIGFFLTLFSTIILITCSNDVNSPITPTSQNIFIDAQQSENPLEHLIERCRTHRAQTNTPPLNELGALLILHETNPINWAQLINDNKNNHLRLSIDLFDTAAQDLQGEECRKLARQFDQRNTPLELRLAVHKKLWDIDEKEGFARASNLMFREKPRGRDRLRPMYLEQIIIEREGDLVNELLIGVAAFEGMEPRARSLAIKEFVPRKIIESSPILESIFDTEGTNFLLRKDALLAILELDPKRGESILLNKMPQKDVDYSLYTFMTTLRKQRNL